MNFRYNKTSQAFTLAELLIVLIIIGVLAGGLWLAFGGSDAKARETACLGNRETIAAAYRMYIFSSGKEEPMNDFINNNYEDTITNNNTQCPSGGRYSVDPDNKNLVVCTFHKEKQVADASRYAYSDLKDENKILQTMTALYGDVDKALATLFLAHPELASKRKEISNGTNADIIIDGVKTNINYLETAKGQYTSGSLWKCLEDSQYNFKINVDPAGNLTSISIKSGGLAYITYTNGNTYQLTDAVWKGNDRDYRWDEGKLPSDGTIKIGQ